MPFWLHEPRVVIGFKGLATTHKLLLFGAIIGFGSAGWYRLLYHPLCVHNRLQERQLVDMQRQKTAFEKTVASLNCQLPLHNNLMHQYAQITSSSLPFQKTIRQILTTVNACGLTCRHLRPIHQKQELFYRTCDLKLSVRGQFDKILAFMERLNELSSFVRVHRMNMQRSKQDMLTLETMIHIVKVINEQTRK